jgi:triosephosphate isomerase
MRKPLIAGNWKMYKTPEQAASFFATFLPLVAAQSAAEIAIFPSITSLQPSIAATAGSSVAIGAQDMHWLDEGAYTSQTSAPQLLAIGCKHVLLGHSELRMYLGETSERVNLKLKAAIRHGLTATVCVGESLAEREANQTEDVLREQLGIALLNIAGEDAAKINIAYEPVWAIGTGLTATPVIAAHAHATLRDELAKHLGKPAAEAMRILYGGSVKPENIASLMAEDDIDGALVGGASLDAAGFAAIVHYKS